MALAPYVPILDVTNLDEVHRALYEAFNRARKLDRNATSPEIAAQALAAEGTIATAMAAIEHGGNNEGLGGAVQQSKKPQSDWLPPIPGGKAPF